MKSIKDKVKKKPKQQKFYAIKVGHECNKIVTTWAECKKLTDHCKGARFKSFDTEEAAAAYLNNDISPKTLVKYKGTHKASSTVKRGTAIKITLETALLLKFSKLCDEYEVTIDKQIERLIKEWADLY